MTENDSLLNEHAIVSNVFFFTNTTHWTRTHPFRHHITQMTDGYDAAVVCTFVHSLYSRLSLYLSGELYGLRVDFPSL